MTNLDSREVAGVAAGVAVGEHLRLEGLALSAAGPAAALELERFEVFTPDARIVVHGDKDLETTGPVPRNLYFRGRLAGDGDSTAVLTILERGGMRGLVRRGGERWILASRPTTDAAASGPIELRRLDAGVSPAGRDDGFLCGADDLPAPDDVSLGSTEAGEPSRSDDTVASPRGAVPGYTARVAIETDYEFLQLFGGGVGAATDYIGDLFAYASGIYADEVDTSLLVSSVDLWSTTNDPWTQSGSSCSLYQFGKYWNDNKTANERTIAHFLSGKNTNSGVAWVGVLCRSGFNVNIGSSCPGMTGTSNFGGGYGFTGGIDGNFNINNPGIVWDIEAVTHEIGHNFNSPHTHCYNGVGGNPAPVDECYNGQCGSGCYCAATSLPCAQAGAGCGTIMSYCHLRSGGLSNISLTFGASHPYGVAPERVPSRMNDHVVSRAASNPGCLDYIHPDSVFSDGFESGSSGVWTVVDP